MATRIETIHREGKLVHIYDNGAEQDAATGRFIKPARGVAFTPETAKLARRKRKEKMQRLTRQRIAETHNGIMPNPVRTASAAFAEALAMLWEQVVLNSEAYPRDRKEVFEMAAKYADLQPADLKEQVEENAALLNAAASAANAETARILARVFADVKKVQRGETIVEGKLVDP
jgi:hypothetical protein